MTALENVLVGMHSSSRRNARSTRCSQHAASPQRRRARPRARAEELLAARRPAGHRRTTLAKNLPYGDQRRLEIARALASDPSLLLLDEPTAGMNPNETADMTALISQLRTELGLTVLLIEHDMRVVMGISDRVTVLDHGERIAEGTPDEVRRNPRVIEAYLGSAGRHDRRADRPPPRRRPPPPATLLLKLRRTSTPTTARSTPSRASRSRSSSGEIVTLIGANGAGKTTTLKTICGLLHPRQGTVTLRRQGHLADGRPRARPGRASGTPPRGAGSSPG